MEELSTAGRGGQEAPEFPGGRHATRGRDSAGRPQQHPQHWRHPQPLGAWRHGGNQPVCAAAVSGQAN